MTVNEGEDDEYIVAVPSRNTDSILDTFTGFTGTIHTLKLSGFTAGVCLNAMQINGSLLIDSDGGTFNTLYQTWSQWATTALGQAENRITALEEQQNADQENLTSLRSDVNALMTRIQSIETGETLDTQYDSLLMDAIESLTSRIEALEG